MSAIGYGIVLYLVCMALLFMASFNAGPTPANKK